MSSVNPGDVTLRPAAVTLPGDMRDRELTNDGSGGGAIGGRRSGRDIHLGQDGKTLTAHVFADFDHPNIRFVRPRALHGINHLGR